MIDLHPAVEHPLHGFRISTFVVSFWHAMVMKQDLLVVVWGCWFAVLGKTLQVIKNPFHFIHQRCQITSG